MPADWRKVLEAARVKPEPFKNFNVIAKDMTSEKFLKFTEFLQGHFLASCSFPLRPMQELKISHDHLHLMLYRNCWNGPFSSAPVTKMQARGPPPRKRQHQASTPCSELQGHPQQAYPGPIPRSGPKF
ncbi:hypothetical protein RRG08_010461 [Elysia crispata]|uniref:Uncharacterized protein n=1 Tax=Elysia crispata TaxID=231223 RepID=A0AAE1E211_9GAST|nr:hypothetical protein RRG08_010461 [Elysia crispata]